MAVEEEETRDSKNVLAAKSPFGLGGTKAGTEIRLGQHHNVNSESKTPSNVGDQEEERHLNDIGAYGMIMGIDDKHHHFILGIKIARYHMAQIHLELVDAKNDVADPKSPVAFSTQIFPQPDASSPVNNIVADGNYQWSKVGRDWAIQNKFPAGFYHLRLTNGVSVGKYILVTSLISGTTPSRYRLGCWPGKRNSGLPTARWNYVLLLLISVPFALTLPVDIWPRMGRHLSFTPLGIHGSS